MNDWRVARSLDVLLDEINRRAPRRSKASDGSIGDAAHASRNSDHNPWIKDPVTGVGVVRARDFTHDPSGGLDCNKLANHLARELHEGHPALASGAYAIWNRRIISHDRLSEGWRPYPGENPHTKHLHLSVTTQPGAAGFDSTAAWGWLEQRSPVPGPLLILHPTRGEPYHVQNSHRGIDQIHAIGGTAADFDLQLTKDGWLVVTHWARPLLHDGFRDPKAKLPRGTTVSQMTLEEVQRLHTPDGFRIRTALDMLEHAAIRGITPCFEAKRDPRMADPHVWAELAKRVHRVHPAVVMSQPFDGAGIETLRAAKTPGLPTMLLARGTVPAEWARDLDYVKGSKRAARLVTPLGVRRVGLGPRDVTPWGAGCNSSNLIRTRKAVEAVR